MVKTNVCVLFGGVSPEHEVSLRSAESVLNHLDPEKYNVLPVGITKEGNWILYGGSGYSKLPTNERLASPGNPPAREDPGALLGNADGQHVVFFRIQMIQNGFCRTQRDFMLRGHAAKQNADVCFHHNDTSRFQGPKTGPIIF